MSDRQATICKKLINLIQQHTPPLVVVNDSTETISFIAKEWDVPILQKEDNHWSPDKRLLCFHFNNKPESALILSLQIGPGNPAMRRRLLDMAIDNQPPFIVPEDITKKRRLNKKYLNDNWNYIYTQVFLGAGNNDIEEIDKQWQGFNATTLQGMRDIVRVRMGI